MAHNLITNPMKYGLIALFLFLVGCSSSTQMQQTKTDYVPKVPQMHGIVLDTVKAQRFDTGRMWTFDYPPLDYFEDEYNFRPSNEWLDKVRMSALRFATYCSASFVSEDGLVMTNHHCSRESITNISDEGEDLHTKGFFAQTLADERRVPELFVDQLVLIKDVTAEVQKAIDEGFTEQEKIANKNAKVKELESKYKEETGLEIQVITLYNGGAYSLYGFKRYNDVRAVFVPETELGYFGGDPDNFTYPRYALDFTFFRVYDDDGKPLKTENYFKWNENGAEEGEPVFVVGNPGRTNRLNTVAQLEYMRDVQYPRTLDMLNALVKIYTKIVASNPPNKDEMQDRLFSFENSQKAYTGMLKGLRDPMLMQRKIDFEKNFKDAVNSKPALKNQYTDLWDKLTETRSEVRTFANEFTTFQLNPLVSSKYFFIAQGLIKAAEQLKLPEDERLPEYQGEDLEATIAELFPEDLDEEMEKMILELQVNGMVQYVGNSHPVVANFTGGKTGMTTVNDVLSRSKVKTKDGLIALAKKGGEAILSSDDPFIQYNIATQPIIADMRKKMNEISARESNYVQMLGRALFEVYGTSIPPDASFSLRIADGVVAGYPYNGTVAPAMTTFYGLYDRYYSFKGKFPWSLPEKWQNPPAEFRLETPVNFVSTNDIVGGNSGSPVINRNAEVVGLAFDGNIESLPGNFIFTTETNRSVSVHSAGMIEAIGNLYKAQRLYDELKTSKIPEKYKIEKAEVTE